MKIPERLRSDPWQPSKAWEEDTLVQWGSKGIVFASENSYTTAFFEAFPDKGGFIRGEGKTLDDAEANAFGEWERNCACKEAGGHRLGRGRRLQNGKIFTYLNGACFCLECGCFISNAMPKIVGLGSYKSPLTVNELQSIAFGHVRPTAFEGADFLLYSHRLGLRAKAFGIELPPITDAPKNIFADDAYVEGCRNAVAEYCRNNKHLIEGSEGGIFESLSRHMLNKMVEQQA